MDKTFAIDLLVNLLERARASETKTFLTTREVEALAILLDAKTPIIVPAIKAHEPELRLQAIDIAAEDIDDKVMLCVDFGTSFSKAFASVQSAAGHLQLIDLAIGDGSTGSRLTTPSELMIDEGRIFFGKSARNQLNATQASPERLIDSIKQFITLNSDVTLLEKVKLEPSQDPTQSFSRRDILVLYLAHLMYLAEKALAEKGLPANVRRRFARPAWKSESKTKNENEMRQMMAEAIVLERSAGDAFVNGLSVTQARARSAQAFGPRVFAAGLDPRCRERSDRSRGWCSNGH